MTVDTAKLGEYLTAKEISETFKIARSGIFNMVKRGDFPAGVKIGACRRWTLQEVKTWLDSQKGA